MKECSEFKKYIQVNAKLEAVEIDEQWNSFLRERGFSNFKLGDYFVKTPNDGDKIIEKKYFERMFVLEDNND